MSVGTGRDHLRNAMQELWLQWQETRLTWQDEVSRDFERQHIEPLLTNVTSVLAATDKLGQAVRRAREECSDAGA